MIDQPDLLTPHYHRPIDLPNATTTLVLGIVSIVVACCFGIVSVICGIIGLVLANKDYQLYAEAPDAYTENSYKVSYAGKVCSIIGLCLGSVMFSFIIIENINDLFS